MDLHSLYVNAQRKMSAELQLNSPIENPGERGEDTNLRWIRWFREYLPQRYSVDKAIVIDSEGCCSDQIDIVIYDRIFSPPLIEDSGSKFITAESVYAVFEVRQKINKSNIEYAISKAESVRRLKRTNTSFAESRGVSKTEPKPILAGILAKSSIDMKSNKFSNYLRKDTQDKILQFGCCCDSAFISDGDYVTPYNGDAPLYWFFYGMLSKLQSVGSVPAIDYSKYLLHLNDSIR